MIASFVRGKLVRALGLLIMFALLPQAAWAQTESEVSDGTQAAEESVTTDTTKGATATPDSALAAKARAQEMINRLMMSADPVVILDYIHWPSAYQAYDPKERAASGISSPEQLREFMYAVLSDPHKFLKNKVERQAERAPPEIAKQLRESAAGVINAMASVKEHIKARIKDTTYQIKSVELLNPDRARVVLMIALDADEREAELTMERHDQVWYIPSVDFAKGEGGSI